MLDLETSLDLCSFCPRLCSHTCPVSLTSGRETLTPQAKMSRFAGLHRGSQGVAPTQDLGAHPAAEGTKALPLYGCTGCGACTTACQHGVEPARILFSGRGESERAELGHPALADLPERHRRRAAAAAQSLYLDDELRARTADPKHAAVALLPSCLPRAAQGGPAEEAKVMLRVCDRLRAARPDFPHVGIAELRPPGPGGCAGYPLYAGGFVESFRLYAESFARSVEKYATLAVSCSACTWVLRTQYREHGVPLGPQILHTSELLAPYADSLPITRPVVAAAYVDACHLGRRLGVKEPPRQLLRRAVQALYELPGTTTRAQGEPEPSCCGSGGLLPTTSPALARAIAREQLASVESRRGPLVSACPACQHHLAQSGTTSVRGLFDILDEATG